MPAKPVGAPKKTVGFTPPTSPRQRRNTASGVGRSPIRSNGSADRQRKGQGVAEPVGEKQLRRREADVVLAEVQDRLAVELDRPVRIGVRMDGSLGSSGRARRIEPESGFVGAGAGGPGERRLGFEEGLELDLAEFERMRRARDDHLVDLVVGPGHRGFQRRLQRPADDRGLRARMLEHVGVVVGGQQRVDGDRHDAGEDRAEEGDRPVDANRA